MPLLRDLDLELSYRTGQNDIIKEFYVPCLSSSVRYDRAVGYFTSGGLSAAAKGIAALIRNGGKMRLVASPVLSEEDYEQIKTGYQDRIDETLEKRVLETLNEIPEGMIKERVEALAWLISEGCLDIKLAYKTERDPGIYHEKMGVFYDDSDNMVAFSGSPNETKGGLVSNFESIDVYNSWSGPRDLMRLQEKVSNFEKLWEDRTRDLRVVPFPEAAKRKLIKLRPDREPTIDLDTFVGVEESLERPHIMLRPYQEDAVKAWHDNNRFGILSMATGTGKTLTALKAIEPLLDDRWIVVVAVPSTLLLEQWESVIKWVYPDALVISCSSHNSKWKDNLFNALNAAKLSKISKTENHRPLFVIATLGTAHKINFKQVIFDNWGLSELCLIVDEVHQSGSPMYSHLLDLQAASRLGLSATPQRDWDMVGWKKILDFFESIVYDYPIKQAIQDGWLSEYEYHVHFVYLTSEEMEEYSRLSKQVQRKLSELLKRYPQFKSIPSLLRFIELHGTDRDQKLGRAVQYILMTRARVLKLAESKTAKTIEVLQNEGFESCIIYCHDSNQMEEVARQAEERSFSVGVYHSKLSRETREKILEDFRRDITKILVAIRCLDEGVDIPKTEGAILVASDRSRRQFIQRRGRLLRPYKDKIARIHDVFVLPISDFSDTSELSDTERNIIECELSRAAVFATDARNSGDIEKRLKLIQTKFGLDLKPYLERNDSTAT